ncbi:MAG: glycosyltransferase, partial [Syntrophomonas sp.]
ILPQAMFAAYAFSGDKKHLKIAHDSLNFLNSILFKEGYLNIIGNQGWYYRESKTSRFDQQPVDAASTIYANFDAYQIIGENEYLEMASLAHQWYRGRNINHLSLYNPQTGGCYDALTYQGVNRNQGAEAVLSLLLSDILMENFIESKIEMQQSS